MHFFVNLIETNINLHFFFVFGITLSSKYQVQKKRYSQETFSLSKATCYSINWKDVDTNSSRDSLLKAPIIHRIIAD